MINLTTNVQQESIRKWSIKAWDAESGIAKIVCESNVSTQTIPPIFCTLSNVAGMSTGMKINATPNHWNDRIVPSTYGLPPFQGGVGVANALDNAISAYVTAYTADGGGVNSKHKAGLKAIELRAVTDGWVVAALGGT